MVQTKVQYLSVEIIVIIYNSNITGEIILHSHKRKQTMLIIKTSVNICFLSEFTRLAEDSHHFLVNCIKLKVRGNTY